MHLATGQSVPGMNPDPNMDIGILSDSVANEGQNLFSAYVKNMKIWLLRSQTNHGCAGRFMSEAHSMISAMRM